MTDKIIQTLHPSQMLKKIEVLLKMVQGVGFEAPKTYEFVAKARHGSYRCHSFLAASLPSFSFLKEAFPSSTQKLAGNTTHERKTRINRTRVKTFIRDKTIYSKTRKVSSMWQQRLMEKWTRGRASWTRSTLPLQKMWPSVFQVVIADERKTKPRGCTTTEIRRRIEVHGIAPGQMPTMWLYKVLEMWAQRRSLRNSSPLFLQRLWVTLFKVVALLCRLSFFFGGL
jgi:hypothetical protein